MNTHAPLSLADKLRFPIPLDFRADRAEAACINELIALNWQEAGCMTGETMRVYTDPVQHTFMVLVLSRLGTSNIECIGRLAAVSENQTRITGTTRLGLVWLIALTTISILSLLLLLPIPGSVSWCGRLLTPFGCILFWYLTLKQRHELQQLIQTSLHYQPTKTADQTP